MITRENYEEFFLSYVDDELPIAVRASVEQFVINNPDLGPELEALQQCRVAPDKESGFRDKDILFQYGSSLLSYVDGEVDEQERQRLEEVVRRNPRAAEELRQLQLTVSQPDTAIVFPGKESLYRGQRRRAVIVLWLRAGIAAAVLGGVALLLFVRKSSSERQSSPGTVAVAPKNNPPAVTSVAPTPLYPVKKDEQTRVVKVEQTQTTVKVEQTRAVKVEDSPKDRETRVAETAVVPSVKNDVAIIEPQPLKVGSLPLEQTKFSTTVAAVNIPREQSSFATQALLQQEQEDSTDNSIAEASATPAKNKLRGLFRKVGRAFGTTAERDGDGQRQVLISAFQVALK